MGKISKNSNLYDKDGKFLHKPGKYTIEELEELVDTLDKNSLEFTMATAILMHMYEQKGEIDSTPTMQNALKPKKQKTVTEIIHDQLGPGYVPSGHKGGRQILVKEVECEDYAQDDSKK